MSLSVLFWCSGDEVKLRAMNSCMGARVCFFVCVCLGVVVVRGNAVGPAVNQDYCDNKCYLGTGDCWQPAGCQVARVCVLILGFYAGVCACVSLIDSLFISSLSGSLHYSLSLCLSASLILCLLFCFSLPPFFTSSLLSSLDHHLSTPCFSFFFPSTLSSCSRLCCPPFHLSTPPSSSSFPSPLLSYLHSCSI